ncbi:MAG: phosphopantetheine-binding protein [bacterium]|nr:phosphopantetheine-binding protein [bacterium]
MLEQLTDIILDYVEVEPEDVKAESEFANDLGFNSYDFTCMISAVEDAADVKIEETELLKIFKVSDLIELIEAKKN